MDTPSVVRGPLPPRPSVAGIPGARPLSTAAPLAARGPLPARVGAGPAAAAPNATLVGRIDHTAQVASFQVLPDDPGATHLPGQYASLGLSIDGRPVQRPYSMASLPRPGEPWEFHVRRVRDGAFTPHLFDLAVGARLRLGPVKGRFILDAGDRRPVLFAATGTGIAPFVAMIRAELAGGRPRPVVLLHGAAHADELGYAELLREWAAAGVPLRYVPTISRPAEPRNAGWTGATGRAEETLARDFESLGIDPGGMVAYLCGNPGMVTAVEETLLARGFAPADVRREAYWLDTPGVASAA